MQLPSPTRSALAASLRGERDMRRENRGPSASAPTPGRYQHRGGGFPGKADPAQGHEREGGRCFYCSRRITHHRRCLDHVVPRAELGQNSYRNLVSCCLECNSQKGERSAEEFLRGLYRERRLSDAALSGRLRALDDLAAGKLIPPLPAQGQGT